MALPAVKPQKMGVLTYALLIIVAILTVLTAGRPLRDELQIIVNWKSKFSAYQNIGTNCQVAIKQIETPLSEADQLTIGRREAIPYAVPYRAEPTYVRILKHQWTYTSCSFLIAKSKDNDDIGYLFLGPLWGDTKIYINGIKVRSTLTPNNITIPVEPEWLEKPIKLEIISWNLGSGAGPMSLIPMTYLANDLDLRAIDRSLQYYRTERSLVPIGICGSMALLFSCCWIFGVRYRDVYWMIIATSLSAISAGLNHDPVNELPSYMSIVGDVSQMLSWTALCIAVYTFIRKPGSQNKLIGIFFGVGILYGCQWLIPYELRTRLIGNINRHDEVPIGIALLSLSYMSFQLHPSIPQRRLMQRKALAFALLILGCFILWSGFYAFRVGITPSTLSRTTFITVFGTFMMIDLVVFQRAYFEEKSLKEEEERRRTALEDRLELGQSIQRLLMPTTGEASYGPFKIHAYFESAEKMAGDWFTWWPEPDFFRVVCGDVVGKGPQAAVASTAILTSCHNFRKNGSSLESLVIDLNAIVYELFSTTSSSTVACAELLTDGTVRIVNHGFAGWIHIKERKSELIPQRGAALGIRATIDCNATILTLAPGERLLIFSDGVAEGPRSMKRICDTAAKHHDSNLSTLTQALIEVGADSVINDDRTLIVIERT